MDNVLSGWLYFSPIRIYIKYYIQQPTTIIDGKNLNIMSVHNKWLG